MSEELSRASLLASLGEEGIQKWLDQQTPALMHELLWSWKFRARPKQMAPKGDWSVWNLRAGRGFGKTRTGSGWFHERAMEFPHWMALVARNPAEARDYMIEGPGGLLRNIAPEERPAYMPSIKRLTWPNGSWATIYSDEEPDQLRGFSGATAWLDELAKFRHAREVWENLEFGMREVTIDRPRVLITTTPRGSGSPGGKVLQEIERDQHTVTVVGSSDENKDNLDPDWFKKTLDKYRGTRLGRQEIDASYINDVIGALWTRQMIEDSREEKAPDLIRVVVAIDPAVSHGRSLSKMDQAREVETDSNLTGIVVAGKSINNIAYILEDLSGRLSPDMWARTAIEAYERHKADRIVAEANQGGEMVRLVIDTIRQNLPITLVWASKAKQARAEPVAALYEQSKVVHVGAFPEMEDQMCEWQPLSGMPSPDRLDAMVWALTDLMIDGIEDIPIPVPMWNSQPRYVPGTSALETANPATVSAFTARERFPG